MLRSSFRLALPFCVLAFAGPLAAQDTHRIWGQVHTVTGNVFEGFLRWDRNEGSWVDILDGSKAIPAENYEAWLDATRAEPPKRTIELKGYRITWDEVDPDFPLTAASGVLFGHIASLTPLEGDSVSLELRSGQRIKLSGGSTDIGPSMRDLILDAPGQRLLEIEWEEIERVEFSDAPPNTTATSPRLYGTVEDHVGRTFTGFLSWDLDEVLQSDVLDGRDEEGDDRNVEFSDIRSIEGHRRSATVSLVSGESIELSGTNDVNRGNRGVQISDPELGMIEVEWEEFSIVRFEDAPASPTYRTFDGGHRLFGTVTTEEGQELTGWIRWDADEEWSWEFLDGRSEDVSFKIEFARIDRIVRDEIDGVHVTLLDGRMLDLDESNDVNWDNKGILVWVETEGVEPSWRYLFWDEFREVQFEHGELPVGSGAQR